MISLFAFVVAIGILVTFHELGHYWVAKLCGVKVLRFSIGFGRPLVRWQKGETEWVICPIPLGGYVRMLDERDRQTDSTERHRSFNQQSTIKRIAIVAAGPVANLLLAIVLYCIVLSSGVTLLKPEVGTVIPNSPAARAGFQAGDRLLRVDNHVVHSWQDIRLALLNSVATLDRAVTVDVVAEGIPGTVQRVIDVPHLVSQFKYDLSVGNIGILAERYLIAVGSLEPMGAAAQAGMRVGDKILSVDNHPITTWAQWVDIVRNSPGKQLHVRIERAGKHNILLLRPTSIAAEYGFVGRIGAAAAIDNHWHNALRFTLHYSPSDIVSLAAEKTVDTAWLSIQFLGRMAIGQASMDNLSGPLTIASVAGKTAREGWKTYLEFLALISISIGVLNLLPIPMLDGGQLMYYMVELVKGKPLSERAQWIGQRVGFALLVSLMAFALLNDISRLLGGG